MNPANSHSWLRSAAVLTFGFIATPISAQITPDATLPNNSVVLPNGNVLTIEGGTEAGGNLFHSFQDFSIPTGSEAFFNNALTIDNIITRITGGNISDIDGLIRANGTANLFLINPNGIVFGENARLDIGGSFFGTTAERIHFADGREFSATDPATPVLLTISVPIGLQFGSNSSAITVGGNGHRLMGSAFIPLDRSNNPIGLQVRAGNTLALLGNEVNFSGGIVAASGGGHLEVGSVSQGRVAIDPTELGGLGDYSAVQQFNDIHLAQQSLLDASGSEGSIQVQGRNIHFTEGSAAVIQNLGVQPSGGITVRATESLNLTGNNPDGSLGNPIQIENLGRGQTGDITISAAQLSVGDGGRIWSSTFTEGSGGNVSVTVDGAIEIDGAAPGNPTITSSIATTSSNSGNGGNMTVSAGTIGIRSSGSITTLGLGSGQVGTLRVDAQDQIEIAGNNPITLIPSTLNGGVIGSGNASLIFINTSRLVVRDGALLGSNTVFTGSAGSVTIQASESIEVTGRGMGSIAPSRITSTAERIDPTTQATFGFPPIPSGDAGSLTINTPSLRITDGALVSVKNDGPGRAGDVQVNANSLVLENEGAIAASTASGNGGNLDLNVGERLLMRGDSLISATAAGTGNGGSISIDSDTIALLENSSITANAFEGAGGNIQITTSGLFVSPNSPITASSQFGVDGTVAVNNPVVDPASGLVALDGDTLDPDTQIQDSCEIATRSRFTFSGSGGLPKDPTQSLEAPTVWRDTRLGEIQSNLTSNPTEEVPETSAAATTPLVEATGWRTNDEGQIELVVASGNPTHSQWQPHPECDSVSQESDSVESSIR